MRPPGVRERMRDLGREERRLVESWSDRALRVNLTVFVYLAARLYFGDHGVGVVLRRFDVLNRVPPLEILGACDRESRFDLVCWNEANSLAEGVQRPYLAARHIASAVILAPQAPLGDFHDPLDRYAIVAPMTRLAVRYEDEPAERDAIAVEIAVELDAFRARAPWPITEPG